MEMEGNKTARARELVERIAKNKPEDGPGVRKARRWLTVVGWLSIGMWWIYFRG